MPDTLEQRRHRSLARVRRLARVLDDAVRVPGTEIRIGIDALIGLLPVAGDAIGAALSGVTIVEAWRLRAPPRLIARMLGNAGIDLLVGLVPVAGDVLDIAWRANRRNLALLEGWLDARLAEARERRRRVPAAIWIGVGIAAAALVLTIALW